MPTRRTNILHLTLAPLATFALLLAILGALNKGEDGGSAAPAATARTTDARIRQLTNATRQRPRDVQILASLAGAYMQKVRETADSSFYRSADKVLARALDLDPRDPGALAAMGSLELARHHFKRGLGFGRRALERAPGVARIYGVVVDAQIELGRYNAAARSLQKMVDLEPSLPSYTRVSYFKELHGDLPGALRAAELAASAGGESPDAFAFAQTLAGNLRFQLGRLDAAERAFRTVLARSEGYGAALAGLGKVEAARGNVPGSLEAFRAAAAAIATPEHLVLLGEAELAAGLTTPAKRHFAMARDAEQTAADNGENTSTELAVLEADHGDPRRAVKLARDAWASAPSVRAANALGWSLTRAGRPDEGLVWMRRALKLGTKDPLFLYHAGISALSAGEDAEARRYLSDLLGRNPGFSPLYAPRAKRALAAVETK
ncbi:MAG: tetratricopeptide repeat protein [Solirubrobacterales bacterium]